MVRLWQKKDGNPEKREDSAEIRCLCPVRDALKIIAAYVTAGLVWVFLSDWLLTFGNENHALHQVYHALLDGLFVLLTGSAFFCIVYRRLNQIKTADRTILQENAKLARTVNHLKIIELSLRRQQAEQAALSETLRREKQLLNNIIENAPVFLMVTDDQGSIIQFNPFAEQLTGHLWRDLFGRPAAQLDWTCSLDFSAGSQEDQANQELGLRSKNGREMTLLLNKSLLLNQQGQIYGQLFIGMDISERRQMEQKLHRLAYEDRLTGLPNRARLEEDGDLFLASAARFQTQVACVYLDIDQFKQINETLGLAAGDRLLKELAVALIAAEAPGHSTYRLNSDEFALLLTGFPDSVALMADLDRVSQMLARPWHIEDHTLFLTASFGIALYPEHGRTVAQLMQSAEVALSRAKMQGRGGKVIFAASMQEHSWKNIRLYNSLQQAINQSQFTLHYQPLIDLASNRITSLEALIRWPDPAGGFVPPMEFIPFAETSGQINAISQWVVETAFAQKMDWHRQGLSAVDIAINLSGQMLDSDQVIPLFEKIARQNGRKWQGIEIEITETSAVRNFDQTIRTLTRLKELGFSIALDDFGTGYSSLTYLRKLPIDRIKMDRSFLRDLCGQKSQWTIFQTIVSLAHELGLDVIAEGVETACQLQLLKEVGCDMAQGFYFYRPMPAADIKSVLNSPQCRPAASRGTLLSELNI